MQGKHFLFAMPGGAGYTECVCNAAGESVGENNRGIWRDAETSFDPTLNRMYASTQGRWLSPDALGGDVANPQSLNRYAYALNNPATLVDPQGLRGCVPGTLNCKTLPSCTTMTCAWEYYGGALFEDYGAQAETGLICVANGVVGYCNGSELSSFISPTGSDAFDALNPSSGVYWNTPPGSPTTALNGETAVSSGSVGFSDLLWSVGTNTSGWAAFPTLTEQPQSQDFVSGNYGFVVYPGLATSQYPGVSAFPVTPDWPPLPPWWFTGQ